MLQTKYHYTWSALAIKRAIENSSYIAKYEVTNGKLSPLYPNKEITIGQLTKKDIQVSRPLLTIYYEAVKIWHVY